MSSDRLFAAAGRRRIAALTATVIVAALVVPAVVAPGVANAGTNLLTESFTNSSVSTTNASAFSVIGNTATTGAGLPCLTAATTATTATGTKIPTCKAGQLDLPTGGDGNGNGALRLTDGAQDEAGAVLYNGTALSLANGADISFDYAQYGGAGNADGINFFLTNGATNLTAAGASGGSLGYAQKTSAAANAQAPGVTNGFLGLGLDEYGNYELDTEGRGTTGGSATTTGTVTCPQTAYQKAAGTIRTPNQVGLRGPGTGFDNYCLLNSAILNATSQSLHGSGKTHLAAGTLETARIVVDPSTATNPMVTVYLAFNQTATDSVIPTEVFQTPEPANAPSTFRFGITASTGGSSDIHEILNLKIANLSTDPTYSLAQSDTSNQVFTAGTPGTFTITPKLASGGQENDNPVVVETLPAGLTLASVPTPTGYTCTGTVGGQTLTCNYTGTLPIAVGTTLPTISVPVTVPSTAAGQYTASATVNSNDSANFATGTDTVTVVAPPVAVTDTATTTAGVTAGTPVTLTVLGNDTGTGTLTVKSATAGAHGTTVVNANGTITYTPAAKFSGTDTFSYTITDARGATSTIADTVKVTPVGTPDSATTPFNTTLTEATSILGNDAETGATTVTQGTTTVQHGTLTLNSNGTYTYVPTTGFAGTDTFSYNSTDAAGQAYTNTLVTITVSPPAAPVAKAETATTVAGTPNGTPVILTVLSNDTGTGTFTPVISTGPTNGKAVVNANGTVTYTPNSRFSGTDTFTYADKDSFGSTGNSVVDTITVTPTGVADAYTTPFQTKLTTTAATGVFANDNATGEKNATLGTTTVQHGTLALATDGSFTYTPVAGYSGTDTFTYTAVDGIGQAVASTLVTITIPKPSVPTATNDVGTTPVNTTLNQTTSVLANDTGTGLTAVLQNTTTHGTLTLATDGTYTYVPTTGYSGTDTFTYFPKDAAGQESTAPATVTITVTPKGVADAYTTPFNTALTTTTANGVLVNDLGTNLTNAKISTTTPAHGSVTVNTNGTFTYTPTTGYSGTDTFTYTASDGTTTYGPTPVTITINPAPPVAVADSGTTAVNTTLAVAAKGVLTNDTGTGTLTPTVVAGPTNGTVTLKADGSYSYTPNGGYSGLDSFTYHDTDPLGQVSNTVAVSLTVTPKGVADTYSTPFQTALTESTFATGVLGNDLGTGLTSAAVVANPANGNVVLSANGTFTYTPKAGFSGTDTFTYTAKDSAGQSIPTTTVTITVPAPGAPIANNDLGTTAANTVLNGSTVLSNDKGTAPLTPTKKTNPAHGTVVLNADGTYLYTPAANYSGPDSFTYTVTDAAGQVSAPATVAITVTPVGTPDNGSTPFNTVLNGASVLTNDGATTPTVTSNTNPSFGTVTVATNGTYAYTPNATYSGNDSFTYTAKDATGQTYGPVTVSLTVGKPAAPVANNDAGTTPVSTTLTVTAANGVLKNDTGTGALTAAKVTNPAHGSVTLSSDGSYSYVPTAGYSGPDSFTYTASDTYGQTSPAATVSLTVTPKGVADSYTTPFNTTLAPTTFATGVLGNDLGSTLAGAVVATNVTHGTLTLAGNGTFSYAPTAGFSGTDTFTYNATDGTTAYGPTTVTIVVGKPAVPVAVNDSGTTPVNTTLMVTAANGVLKNDSGTGTLTATKVGSASHGTVTLSGDGSYTYTPVSGYTGPDSFTYVTSDTYGQTSAAATVSLTVTPKGVADSYSTPFQTALTVSAASGVLTNDLATGAKGATVATTAANGTLTLNTDGSFTYTPKAGFSGTDSFTYNATDGTTAYGPTTVTIAVPAPNAPAAANDSASTPANTTLNGTTVLANDSGTAPLTPTKKTDPAHGTVTLNSDGTYVYVPTANYSGPDSFTYTVTDAANQTSTPATVTITVTPVGVADSYTTPFNTAKTVNPTTNDAATTPTVTSVTGTSTQAGTVVLNADGTVTYTPKAGFTGVDTFSYNAKDASNKVYGPTVVTVTVGKPAAPVAVLENATTTAGTAVSLPVTGNDTGTGTLTPAISTGPTNGTATVNSDGSVTYTPKAGFSGTDSFTYSDSDTFGQTSNSVVDTLTVKPVGVPDSGTTPFNTTLTQTTSILANDLATGAKSATVAATTTHGKLTLATDGTYTYVPTTGFAGVDTFTYNATDASGQAYGPTTVTITVGKPPVPVANADSGGTVVNTPLTVAAPGVLTNDTGTGALTAGSASSPAHGAVTLNSNGGYTYTPTTGYSGPDSFTYTATDTYGQTSAAATVSLTVTPKGVPDAYSTPFQTALTESTFSTGVLGNDLGTGLTAAAVVAQPANGTLSFNTDGTFTYTPATSFSGTDTFTYTAKDSAGQSIPTTTVTITVPAPGAPVANGDTGTTAANTVLNGSTVLSNDKGTAPLVPTKKTDPAHGTVTLKSDGTYVYTPASNYSGPDSFTYTVTDAAKQTSAPATVSLTVTPVGAPDAGSTPFNTVLNGTSVLANDAATTPSVTGYSQPANGTVTVAADGTYVYTPNPTYSGLDSFTYTAKDASSQTYGPITVSLTVGKPAAPTAVADKGSTPVSTTLTVTAANGVLSNDKGTGTLTAAKVTNPAHGSVTLSSDGSYSYVPTAGYSGPDSFTYTASDTYGQTSPAATVSLTVTPKGVADSYTATFQTLLSVPVATGVLSNDLGSTLAGATVVTNVAHGTLALASNGSFTYTPASGFSGTDTFTYNATDGTTGYGPTTVTITVPAPGGPVANNDTGKTVANTVLNGTSVLTNDTGTAPLTATKVGNASNGTVVLAGNGTYTYTPTTGFSGTDSFTYTATDAAKQTSAPATVTITVTPVGSNDTGTTPFNTTLNQNTSVFANDAATSPTITNSTQPSHGSVTVDPSGIYVYVPNPGYAGADSFTYSAKDSSNQPYGPVTVNLTVGNPAPPVAVKDAFSTPVNTTLTVAANGVLGNDTGAGALSSAVVTTTTKGTLTLKADGSLSYVPNTGVSGTDTFTYRVSDTYGQSSTVTDTVTVIPTGTADTATTPFNTTLTQKTSVLANDNGSTLTGAAVVTGPTHGTLTLATDGTYTYVPAATYAGTDTFTYNATDGTTGYGPTTVTIVVGNPAAPKGVADSYSTPVNTTLTVPAAGVLTNDTGTGTRTAGSASTPAHGTVTLDANGGYTYTPTGGYTGPDSFTYVTSDSYGQSSTPTTVTLAVTPKGVADSYSTPFQTKLTVPAASGVLANDLATGGKAVAVVTNVASGTLALAADGSFTYTPKAGFSGSDSFTYNATDASGQAFTNQPVTVTLTVPAPGAPVANPDSGTIQANATLAASSLTTNDSGTAPLKPTKASDPTHGTVTINPDGTYTYVPAANYSGPDSFTYTVTDAAGQSSAPATVSITVTPVGNPDTGSTPFNTPLKQNVGVLANDGAFRPTVTGNTQPAFGTVTVATDGTYVYTPNPTFAGSDSFTYTAKDNSGQTYGPVTVSLTVGNPAAPVAKDDLNSTPVGTALTTTATSGDVLTNDSGTGTLTATLVTGPTHGKVTLNGDGTYTYTPTGTFTGTDSFTYTASDTYGQTSAAATVTITVVPSGVADSYTTPFNAALTVNAANGVLTNDKATAATGATVVAKPANGTLTLATDGSFTYTPATGFAGVDTFTYNATDGSGLAYSNNPVTATITVGKPAPPVANADGPYSVNANTPTNIITPTLLKNDTGTGTLTATAVTQPAHGAVTVNSDGTYTYTPNTGYSGPDSFTYSAVDSFGQTSAPATVTVSVKPVGVADTYSTQYETALSAAAPGVLGNDRATGAKNASVTTNVTHGTLALLGDGSFTYTPVNGYSGTDSFAYSAQDASGQSYTATATITIAAPGAPTASNDTYTTPANTVLAPATQATGVLGNDTGDLITATQATGTTHGAVTNFAPNGTFTYTPNAGFSGRDTFTYTVTDSDGQTAGPATVTIQVTPVGTPDSATVVFNTPFSGTSVLTNDAASSPTVTGNTAPAHGSVTVKTDGTYVYTPNPTYSGADSFTYTARDGSNQNQTYGPVTVSLTVSPPAAPVAVNDAAATPVNTPVTVADNGVLANDTGTGALTAGNVTPTTAGGTVTVKPTGGYTYTPPAGFSGKDTFTYTASDTYKGTSAPATVTITVTPLGAADSYTTPFATVLAPTTRATGVLGNDTGSTLSVTGFTQPGHGTVAVNNDGTFTYTPTSTYAGQDSFTYTATDGTTTYGPITVSVVVNPPVTPTAVDDKGSTSVNTPLTVGAPGVLGNDTGTGTLTALKVTDPAHGTVTLTAEGGYTYTPANGYSGPDSFTYTASDTYGQTSAPATVNLTVTPTGFADAYSTGYNTPLTVGTRAAGVLGNDLGSSLTVASNTQAANGTVVLNPDGTFTYTPGAGFIGNDTFTYVAVDTSKQTTASVTVKITVGKPGAPVAVNDSGSTTAGVQLVVPASGVLTNDTGTGPLTVTQTSDGTSGKAVLKSDGSYTYTPAAGFSGKDIFTYTTSDSFGNTSTPATVTVTVAPTGTADSGTVSFNTPFTPATGVLGNDLGTGLTVTANTNPSHGTVSISPSGTYTYTPTAGYTGSDSFTYTATDSSSQSTGPVLVSLTVGTPAAPTASTDTLTTPVGSVLTVPAKGVLANDSGTGTLKAVDTTLPTHGSLTLNADGSLTYTPTAGYSGPDSFTYSVTDSFNQTSAPATVTITVTPVGVADSGSVTYNTPLNQTTSVLSNDQGSTLTGATVGTQPTHGKVTLDPTGTYVYTPTTGYDGPDSFTYTATDGTTTYGPVTVSLTVNKPGAPVAKPDAGTTPANVVLNGTGLLTNDTGTGLTATQASNPAHGAASVTSAGAYTYTPATNFSGKDTFTYTATDSAGQVSAPATVTVTVTPVTTGDTATAQAGSPLTVTAAGVLSNDVGTALTATDASTPAHGTVTLNSDGSFTYTPAGGYSGPDSFTYNAFDGTSKTPGTVTINVIPTGVADSGTTTYDTALTSKTSVLANDLGTGLITTPLTNGPTSQGGTVTLDTAGNYTYTPKTGFTGTDTFTYTGDDSVGTPFGPVLVTITVTNPTAPVAVADSYPATAGTPLTQPAVTGLEANDAGTGTLVAGNVSKPANGTVTVAPDGSFTYTPTGNFSGTDTFTYTVTDGFSQTSPPATVTIKVNPSAVNDTATTAVNTTLAGTSVLANDTGTALKVTPYSGPTKQGGTLALAADGTYSYTPAKGFSGPDTYTYTVTDKSGTTAQATLTINVSAGGTADTGTTNANTPLNGTSVLANDGGSGLTATPFSGPTAASGTVTVNSDGTYLYTPPKGFSGTDSFTYSGTDSAGNVFGPVKVTITVKPVAVGDTAATPAGTPISNGATLLGNDLGSNLTVASSPTTSTAGGTVKVNPDGTYSYTPPAPTGGFSGPDTFTYTVTDGTSTSAAATVTVNVAPVATADKGTTAYQTPLNGASVLGNDLGSGLRVTAVTQPPTSAGRVAVNPDGTYTFTPANGFVGTTSFGYTVTDTSKQTSATTVTITVLPPGPVANPDSGSTTTGITLSNGTNLLTNDSGAGPLKATDVTQPTHGTVTVNGDGSYVYKPATGFSGTDTFTYTATDAANQVSPAGTVTITVAPKAAPDAQSVASGSTLTATVPTATGSGPFTYAPGAGANAGALHGTVTFNPDGKGGYTYTPAAGYTGPDSFTYTATDASGVKSAPVTISITVITPAAPVAAADKGTTLAGQALTNGANLLTNDKGTGTLTTTKVTDPAHGTVTVNPDGTYAYTPTGTYSGTDTFTYSVTDGFKQTSAPATVTITVVPVAAADAYTVPGGAAFTTTTANGVVVNDIGTGLTAAAVTQPAHGALTLNPNGTFTYTPTGTYTGSDSFTYTVTDGTSTSAPTTVSLTIGAPNAPVANPDKATTPAGTVLTNGSNLLANDTGAGPLSVSAFQATSAKKGTVTVDAKAGTYTYTPPAGFSGTDTFTYTVTDAFGTPSAAPTTVTILVVPVAAPDSATLTGGKPYTGSSLLANDTGTGLTAVVVTQPAHGKLTIDPTTGTYVYTPTGTYSGPDSFTYQAKDADGNLSPAATVTLNVVKPGVPVANPDSASDTAGAPLTNGSNLLDNDTGATPLTAAVASAPANGTVTVNPDGSYSYTPKPGFSGTDTFTYNTTDAFGQVSATPGTVTVTVLPTATPGSASVVAGTTLAAQVPTPNGTGPFTVAAAGQPAHGTLTVNPDGSYSYTPASGFTGTDTFSYTVTDAAGNTSSPATLSVNVLEPAAPVGAPDTATTKAGTPVTGASLLGNDTGTGPLTATKAGDPAHGTVAVNPDGTFTYTPAAGYSGPDSFTYTVSDTYGQTSAPVTVTVSVAPSAAADAASTPEGATLNGASVLGNDTGTGLTAVLVSGPTHGTLTLNPNGTYTYVPTPGYAGPDSFTYVAKDAAGNTSAAVAVSVTVVAATPVIVGGTSQTIGVGTTPAPITVTGPTGSNQTVTTSKPGSLPPGVKLGPTGDFTGTANKPGTYTFPVTVTDPAGGTSTKSVTIVVKPAPTRAVSPVATVTTVGNTVNLPLGGTITKVTGTLPPGIKVLGSSLVGKGTRPGKYTVTVTLKVKGQTATRKVTITVRPRAAVKPVKPTQPTRPLSFTGAPVSMLLGWALALLALGLALVGFAAIRNRRRRGPGTAL